MSSKKVVCEILLARLLGTSHALDFQGSLALILRSLRFLPPVGIILASSVSRTMTWDALVRKSLRARDVPGANFLGGFDSRHASMVWIVPLKKKFVDMARIQGLHDSNFTGPK